MTPPEGPVRVLHLIDHLKMGGAQTVLLGLLRNFDAARVASVVCSLRGGDFFRPAVEEAGAEVISLPGDWASVALAPWRVAGIIRRSQVDLVHAHLDGAKAISALARGRAPARGRPGLIWHEHSAPCPADEASFVRMDGAREGGYRARLCALLAPRADLIVGCSEFVTQEVQRCYGLPPERLRTVHNAADLAAISAAPPTDLRAELSLPDDCTLLGFGGRLTAQKGVSYLLQAMSAVLAAYPATHLVIAGDGPLRGDLEREAGGLGLGAKVTFLGRRSDMVGILKGLDLYVQPSLWEGLPMVILEAMGAGRPVVATAVSGTPEVVVEGETGLLVPPRDSAALAQALGELVNSPQRRRALGQAGRARVEERFTFRGAARQMEELYRALLADLGTP